MVLPPSRFSAGTVRARGWCGMPEMTSEPWARIKLPMPIPDEHDQSAALQAMADDEFVELVRGHLLPRGSGREREAWVTLWENLTRDEGLLERTFDVLESFLDVTDRAIETGALEEAAAVRANKFRTACEGAWSRLQRADDDGPLAWAPWAAEKFDPEARSTIALLVSAIARHRSSVTGAGGPVRSEDQVLWDRLRVVRLDPRDYRRR